MTRHTYFPGLESISMDEILRMSTYCRFNPTSLFESSAFVCNNSFFFDLHIRLDVDVING